jgi:acyl transferase domain-containing protein
VGRELEETEVTQAALFAVQTSLGRMWIDRGVKPGAMIGHSIGELVAASLSGVMSLEEGVGMVVERGRVMKEAPRGVMMGVGLGEKELEEVIEECELSEKVTIGAVNGPEMCVASGEREGVERLREEVERRGVSNWRVRTSHGYHSGMMREAGEKFEKYMRGWS